jgi:tripartite-type tricarboxylate transporter receptor subunit TctC
MLTTRLAVSIVSLGSMILSAGVVSGQNYPNKPIRIVTSDAGGTGDTVSRIIVPGLSGSLGQQVIVDNRAAVIARDTVMKASPDGYTLLVDGVAFWIAPLLQKMSYDPVSDFSPISSLIMQPNILVVHPSLPVKSVQELIALAKARPGELNYGTAAIGGSSL